MIGFVLVEISYLALDSLVVIVGVLDPNLLNIIIKVIL